MIDVLARVPLAPILAAQAVWVRTIADFLPEPPGDRSGVVGQGPDLRMLIFGDSSAAGVGAPHQNDALCGRLAAKLGSHVRLDFTLEAKTGRTTQDALKILQAMPDRPFDLALVVLGVNDVTRATPVSTWVRQRRRLHDALREQFGVRWIVATGLPPMGQFPLLPNPLRWILGQQAQRFDAALAQICTENVMHAPLPAAFDPVLVASDGYHPNAQAYQIWADGLAAAILALPGFSNHLHTAT